MKHVLVVSLFLLLPCNVFAQEIDTYFDLEKRYNLTTFSASDTTSWISIRFMNVCTGEGEGHPDVVTSEFRTIPCKDAARGEVVTLPEHASVVVGTPASENVNGYTVDYVFADSLRRVILEVPPGSYSLRGGHLRTFRIDVPPFQVQRGDSIVIDMEKTFLPILGCQMAGVVLSPPDPRADYLLRREDALYLKFRYVGITAACYRNTHDFLSQLPVEER